MKREFVVEWWRSDVGWVAMGPSMPQRSQAEEFRNACVTADNKHEYRVYEVTNDPARRSKS